MEEMKQQALELWQQALDFYNTLPPLYQKIALALIPALILLWIIIRAIRRSGKKDRTPKVKLELQSFQLSPLKRDAFVKIKNMDGALVISKIEMPDNTNVYIKNDVNGHQMATGDTYSLLLESIGAEPIRKDLTLRVHALLSSGKVVQKEISIPLSLSK